MDGCLSLRLFAITTQAQAPRPRVQHRTLLNRMNDPIIKSNSPDGAVVLPRFVLRFWPLGVRVPAKAGWSIFAARRKKRWWQPPWMTSAAGGTYPYWEAVLIFKQDT